MVTTHTPGPWIADSWYVGPKDLPTLVKVNPNGPLGHEEVIANARLVAEAPAMLALLRRIADYWAGGDVPADLDADMRALLGRVEA